MTKTTVHSCNMIMCIWNDGFQEDTWLGRCERHQVFINSEGRCSQAQAKNDEVANRIKPI